LDTDAQDGRKDIVSKPITLCLTQAWIMLNGSC